MLITLATFPLLSIQNQVEKERENLTPYTHSIKVEETAKGIRVHVHVYGNGEEDTIATALRTYEKTVDRFKERGHTMAPMNGEGRTSRTGE